MTRQLLSNLLCEQQFSISKSMFSSAESHSVGCLEAVLTANIFMTQQEQKAAVCFYFPTNYFKSTYYCINCVSAKCTYNSAECTLTCKLRFSINPFMCIQSVLHRYRPKYYLHTTFPLCQHYTLCIHIPISLFTQTLCRQI